MPTALVTITAGLRALPAPSGPTWKNPAHRDQPQKDQARKDQTPHDPAQSAPGPRIPAQRHGQIWCYALQWSAQGSRTG